MLRNSIKNYISELDDNGELTDSQRDEINKMVTDKSLHLSLRSELMTVVYPIKMNKDGPHQSAAIEAVINRVNMQYIIYYTIFYNSIICYNIAMTPFFTIPLVLKNLKQRKRLGPGATLIELDQKLQL